MVLTMMVTVSSMQTTRVVTADRTLMKSILQPNATTESIMMVMDGQISMILYAKGLLPHSKMMVSTLVEALAMTVLIMTSMDLLMQLTHNVSSLSI